MTTPLAPGAPEAGQTNEAQDAPGAQDQAAQQEQPKPTPKPGPQPLGKPQTPGASKQPEPAKTDDDPQDVASLPEWAQKALKKARDDAGHARTNAKKQAAEQATADVIAKISKTLGRNADDEPTVESLTQQLQERQARIDELEGKEADRAYDDMVRAAAKECGADPDALLDSNRFVDDVKNELSDDYDDADMAKAIAKIAKVYAKKPRFAKQAAAPRSGSEITGGPPPAAPQRARSLKQALDRAYGIGT